MKPLLFSVQRASGSKFSNDELANVLYIATKNPASAIHGRGAPTVLRLVEMMGIE